jgi:hypothetical protein
MPGSTVAETEKDLDLRIQALEANKEELPQMEVPRQKGTTILTEMKELRVKQASLTASKQQVTKRLTVLNNEAKILMTSIDAGLRAHFGTRSEKLVEFGRQPFRSQPRVKLVEVVVPPVPEKPGSSPAEDSAPPLKK